MTPPPTSGGLIAGAEIKVGGQTLDPTLAGRLLEVRVQDNLMLPDTFVVRILDPGLEHVDSNPLDVGAEVEVLFAASDQNTRTSVLKGQVTSLEPEFGPEGVVIAARGYDQSHKLNRSKETHTYQNMTAGDIARKVAGRAGLSAGTIDDAGGPHEFVQQNNQTDWEFLWSLASRLDFEVVVEDRKLHFRKAGGAAGQPPSLRWGDRLLSFRPRVTGVQQVDEVTVRGWDEKTKQAIESTAKAGALSSEIGIKRSSVSGALGGGKVLIADEPITTAEQGDALARALVSQLANSYVEAEGLAKGDPRLRAGTKVEIGGVGTRFGGTYALSSTTHVYRSARGYQTHFAVSGRAPRTLVDLMTPASRKTWGNSVVVGVVTQNDDPDGLGRVRVKYPNLGEETEGWWARIASPAAGDGRGLLMLPQVGDEVVVGFEHDDVRRPYVLGSVFNGKGKPGDLAHTDGSFGLASDKDVDITAKGKISIKATGDVTIETDGKVSTKATGDLTIEGQKVSIKAQSSLSIEASAEITIKAPQLTLEGSGMVKVSAPQVMLG